MYISACGLICNDCPFFKNPCTGCFDVKGKTFWAKEATAKGICQLYDCSVNQRRYENCGDCSELPCQMFKDQKDPNISQKEHNESIVKRVKILKNNTLDF